MPGEWSDVLPLTFGYGVIHYLNQSMPDWKHSKTEALEKAREDIGFQGGTLQAYVDGYNAVESFARDWTHAGRKTFPIRIAKGLFFECRDGEGITEREFRILAAVFSVIGTKGYNRAGWEIIQWRAAGYLQRPPQEQPAKLYPRGQIERSLIELRSRGLITCFSYGKGHGGIRYWAPGTMPFDKLAHAVLAHLNKARERRISDAQASRKLCEQMPLLTNVSGT
jgi:hypothetical protein